MRQGLHTEHIRDPRAAHFLSLQTRHTCGMSETEERPRALQMAAKVEKLDPPLLDDVFAAAAQGVIALLDDHRSLPGGEWHEEVAAWNGARIRKIMRRARASAWIRAQEVPGLTIVHGTAHVRVFVPGRIDEAPPELSKLQIQSSPLDEPERAATLEPVADPTLTILLNPAVEMSWGKRGAQVAHAAQRCWEGLERGDRLDWNAAGRPVRVVTPRPELWEVRLQNSSAQIRDGGFTEIAPGTLTSCASLDK
ncbi:MAG: peptidyl-tRNA hydrolase [Verrucomicrobiales bacterium]|jgi:peptidyl-tRNA hydrolase